MLGKITPGFLSSFGIKKEDELFITGYPGETGAFMHQIRGKVFDTIWVDNDATKLLVFKNIKASGGLNGAPVLKIEEYKVSLVGLYVGYDESCDIHVVTCIVQNLKAWVVDLMKERLLIKDLEIKLLKGHKYHKKTSRNFIKKEEGRPTDMDFFKTEEEWVVLDKDDLFE